jgi:hypothetical protein
MRPRLDCHWVTDLCRRSQASCGRRAGYLVSRWRLPRRTVWAHGNAGHLCDTPLASSVHFLIRPQIIAVHTFNLLFLRILVPRKVMWAALIGGWAAVITFILGGPAVLDVAHNGPFFAISGYWCWISGEYPVPRITSVLITSRAGPAYTDRLLTGQRGLYGGGLRLCSTLVSRLTRAQMFLSAFLCFVIYTLVFLRLRGHIYHDNGRLRLRIRAPARLGVGSREENFGRTIAKKMMMYVLTFVRRCQGKVERTPGIRLHTPCLSCLSPPRASRRGSRATCRSSGQSSGWPSWLRRIITLAELTGPATPPIYSLA